MKTPEYIERTKIDIRSKPEPLDHWDFYNNITDKDRQLIERCRKISHRARIALCIAIGGWIVFRLRRPASRKFYQLSQHYLEALWAWQIDYRLTVPFHPDDEEFSGPAHEGLALVMDICNDAFERCNDQDNESAENPAWMAALAGRLLPETGEFDRWLEVVLERLETHFVDAYDEDDYFLEKDYRGEALPFEVMNPDLEFDYSLTAERIDRFVNEFRSGKNIFYRTDS